MRNGTKNTLALVAAGTSGYLLARHLARKGRELSPKGRVAVVMGGSRGLGFLIAKEFARRGAKVAVCARDESELFAVRAAFADRGPNFFAMACDVTDEAQVAGMVEHVGRELGPIDFLVNNAGTMAVGPVETMQREDFEKAMKTHFWGPLYATMAVLPGMQRRREGRIVNISSVGGKIAVPHMLPYSASKFALVGLSEGLRSELAKDNVYVSTICPGLMRTGSPRHAEFKGQHRLEYAWFVLNDSMPGLTMSAARAARQVVEAAVYGDAGRVLSFPAWAAVKVHGMFPRFSSEVLRLANRVLPKSPVKAGAGGMEGRLGKHSETWLTRSGLTALTRKAERENLQVVEGGGE